jgi:hypothetical protein
MASRSQKKEIGCEKPPLHIAAQRASTNTKSDS